MQTPPLSEINDYPAALPRTSSATFTKMLERDVGQRLFASQLGALVVHCSIERAQLDRNFGVVEALVSVTLRPNLAGPATVFKAMCQCPSTPSSRPGVRRAQLYRQAIGHCRWMMQAAERHPSSPVTS